jgi:hypothetical protein
MVCNSWAPLTAQFLVSPGTGHLLQIASIALLKSSMLDIAQSFDWFASYRITKWSTDECNCKAVTDVGWSEGGGNEGLEEKGSCCYDASREGLSLVLP